MRVGAVDRNGDGKAEIVCVAGPGGGPDVRTVDATTQQQLDIHVTDPFSVADERERVAEGPRRGRSRRARARSDRRLGYGGAGAAAVIVLAAAISARDAQRCAVGVRRDHRVHAVRLADAADVLEGISRAIPPLGHAWIIAGNPREPYRLAHGRSTV